MSRLSLQSKLNMVYDVLVEYMLENQFAPSTRELSELTGFSKSMVVKYLEDLESQGKIIRRHNKARCIELVEVKRQREEFRKAHK